MATGGSAFLLATRARLNLRGNRSIFPEVLVRQVRTNRVAVLAAGFAAACVLAIVPATAGAALIGPSDLSLFNGTFAGPISYVNAQLPQGVGKVKAPYRGKITRWGVSIGTPHDAFTDDGPLRLQILKRTADEPGAYNDEFKMVRQTPPQAVTPGLVQHFNANLKIRKGQFIGLFVPEDTEVAEADDSPATMLQYLGGFEIGAPGDHADFVIPGLYLVFNARVKRT